MSTIIEVLTDAEEALLAQHEQVISRGIETFIEVGLALMAIADRQLYRAAYPSFQAYLDAKWPQIGRTQAYRLMGSAQAAQTVSNWLQSEAPDIPAPTTESHARELAKVPAEQQGQVWAQAVATAPEGKVTAAHVAAVRDRGALPADVRDWAGRHGYRYESSEHDHGVLKHHLTTPDGGAVFAVAAVIVERLKNDDRALVKRLRGEALDEKLAKRFASHGWTLQSVQVEQGAAAYHMRDIDDEPIVLTAERMRALLAEFESPAAPAPQFTEWKPDPAAAVERIRLALEKAGFTEWTISDMDGQGLVAGRTVGGGRLTTDLHPINAPTRDIIGQVRATEEVLSRMPPLPADLAAEGWAWMVWGNISRALSWRLRRPHPTQSWGSLETQIVDLRDAAKAMDQARLMQETYGAKESALPALPAALVAAGWRWVGPGSDTRWQLQRPDPANPADVLVSRPVNPRDAALAVRDAERIDAMPVPRDFAEAVKPIAPPVDITPQTTPAPPSPQDDADDEAGVEALATIAKRQMAAVLASGNHKAWTQAVAALPSYPSRPAFATMDAVHAFFASHIVDRVLYGPALVKPAQALERFATLFASVDATFEETAA